jgi:hypothetical protein
MLGLVTARFQNRRLFRDLHNVRRIGLTRPTASGLSMYQPENSGWLRKLSRRAKVFVKSKF